MSVHSPGSVRSLAVIIAVVGVTGCDSGLTNMELEVFPDGTGRFDFAGVCDASAGAVASRPTVTGARSTIGAIYSLVTASCTFDVVNAFEFGDVRFAFSGNEQGCRLVVDLPTSRVSAWYTALGLSRESATSLDQAVTRMRQRNANVTESRLDPTQWQSVLVRVIMPGPVLKQGIEGGTPEGWVTRVERKSNRAVLQIPIEDLLRASSGHVKWVVECGELSEGARQSWQRFKGGK